MRVSDGAPTAPDALLVLPASDRDIAGATLQVGDRMEIAQTILQGSARVLQGVLQRN